jgi:uncharacterized protein YkwD
MSTVYRAPDPAATTTWPRSRSVRVAGSIVAVGWLLWVGLAGTALAWSPTTFDSGSEQRLFELLNQARVQAGRSAVHWDAVLASVARSRSRDMIVRDYFSHTILGSGLHVWDLLDARGYCYRQVGEDIGWTQYWPDAEAAGAIFGLFMHSPLHRGIILGRAWDAAGIGAYTGADDRIMFTLLFAARCAG